MQFNKYTHTHKHANTQTRKHANTQTRKHATFFFVRYVLETRFARIKICRLLDPVPSMAVSVQGSRNTQLSLVTFPMKELMDDLDREMQEIKVLEGSGETR